MAVTTFEVKGMTCGGCVNSVTKALKAVRGVQAADVSLEKQQAVVTFAEEEASVADLKQAVEDAGYDV
ncbi:MAG: heavy-metal-associated domain-containing protein [Bacilli bacterium]